MRVFLAWSGKASEQLALFMHDWLPSVVQAIEPFMSSEDIRKGQRWANEIGAKLADVNFALLCLTPANLNSRWIHFEAGAVSKNVEHARVSALLLDVAPTQIEFPLQQFQHTQLTRDDLWKLLQDLNKLCTPPLADSSLKKSFDRSINEVETVLDSLRRTLQQEERGHTEPQRSTDDILADLLNVQQGLASKLDVIDTRLRGTLLNQSEALEAWFRLNPPSRPINQDSPQAAVDNLKRYPLRRISLKRKSRAESRGRHAGTVKPNAKER